MVDNFLKYFQEPLSYENLSRWKTFSNFRSPAIYEPSAFFSATPQPTPLPSPTGSDQSSRRENETNRAFEFHNALAGINIQSKRLPPHKNDEVLPVASAAPDIRNSILKKQKKASKNNLDRPMLILTMPSISDDGDWISLYIYHFSHRNGWWVFNKTKLFCYTQVKDVSYKTTAFVFVTEKSILK